MPTYEEEDEGNFAMEEDDNDLDKPSDRYQIIDDEEDDCGIVMGKAVRDDEFAFVVLTPEELTKEMMEMITDVQNVVQLKPTQCRAMLTHFKWYKNKMLEAYYDAKDNNAFFLGAQLVSPQQNGGAALSMKPCSSSISSSTDYDLCKVCVPEQSAQRMVVNDCGHQFCMECWDAYLTQKVMGEGISATIECMQIGCKIFVDDALALRLLTNPAVKRSYHQLMTKSFVDCNRRLRFCPAPDCVNAIKVEQFAVRPVLCSCGYQFCFSCGQEWHELINCRLLGLWQRQCIDDRETCNWIVANTKDCPKCAVTIEKNGGCNHMQCKSQSCLHEFCWMCLGPWDKHGGYTCNRFQDDTEVKSAQHCYAVLKRYFAPCELHGSSWDPCNQFDDTNAKNARDAQERSNAALARYLHYCSRYMNHQLSAKLEHKLYARAKTKMDQMLALNMSWTEVQFIKKAVDTLTLCRRTLMFSYAFAYYLVSSNEVDMFEENQRYLEVATEELSEYLERDMANQDQLPQLKQAIQDKCNYVQHRRDLILEHCREGEEKNWWHYNA